MTRRSYTQVTATAVAAIVLCITPSAQASSPHTSDIAGLQARNALLLRKLGKRERQLARAHAELRRSKRAVRASVIHAIRLASVVYGVPASELASVGSCESHLWPFAQNGQYRGLFQEGPMFERGIFGRAGFSVWDTYANVFTAAWTVAREGWRQWECRP